jgi:hypothetical protein
MAIGVHDLGCAALYRAQVFACQWAGAGAGRHHPLPDETPLEDVHKTIFAKAADCA